MAGWKDGGDYIKPTLSIIIPCKNEPDIHSMMTETEAFCPKAQIIVSSDQQGRGKGWALRQGVEHAKGEYICFIDGDLDISPYYIAKFKQILDHDSSVHVVIGHKPLSGDWTRKLITFCSRLFIGTLFGLWIDTQTGIKMFRRECLPSWADDSFAFDLEILSKCKAQGFKIREYPVTVSIRKKMPGSSILRFIKGALKIWLRLR